jgi:hypothetical protein
VSIMVRLSCRLGRSCAATSRSMRTVCEQTVTNAVPQGGGWPVLPSLRGASEAHPGRYWPRRTTVISGTAVAHANIRELHTKPRLGSRLGCVPAGTAYSPCSLSMTTRLRRWRAYPLRP